MCMQGETGGGRGSLKLRRASGCVTSQGNGLRDDAIGQLPLVRGERLVVFADHRFQIISVVISNETDDCIKT